MARNASSHSVLCSKHRWCNYYRDHDGPCHTEPPGRDCVCKKPDVRSTWSGKDCRKCGKRVT